MRSTLGQDFTRQLKSMLAQGNNRRQNILWLLLLPCIAENLAASFSNIVWLEKDLVSSRNDN